MTAPVATARGTPSGIRLDEGYQTLVTLAASSTVAFWEKTVTPPGIDGGDPVDTTTMHNVRWMGKNPQTLIEMTEFSMTAAYDPVLYTTMLSLVNVKTTVTITFPDGSTLAFYGYLKSFAPDAIERGTQPEATITVIPTNQDPSTGAEEDPVLTNVAGT